MHRTAILMPTIVNGQELKYWSNWLNIIFGGKHCFENICDVMSWIVREWDITDFNAQKISALCCSLVNVNLESPHWCIFSTCLYASFPVYDFRAGCPILDRENDLMHNLHFALVLFEGSGNSQSLYSTLSIPSLLNLIAMMSLNC